MQPYPKWRYTIGESKIVMTQQESDSLGFGWYNTPTELENAQRAQSEDPPKADDREQLIEKAEASGVKIDKRWTTDKIREVLG